jgi:hypothetical protein
MMRLSRFLAVAAAVGLTSSSTWVQATPYASGVTKTGTSVSFILNEPTDVLKYTINGGSPVTLDGTTKGTKTFTLGSATDTFSIIAEKTAATGFLIPTGGTVSPNAAGCAAANSCTGLSLDSPASGFNLVSDDASTFSRYNSPRGVSVNQNPNTPYFGNVYITNSVAGSVLGSDPTATPPRLPPGPNNVPLAPRTLTGEGLYAVHADESDAFGNGDAAVNPINVDTFPAFSTASTNSPYRLTVASNGRLFVTDYSDVNGQLFEVDPNISIAGGAGTNQTATNIFAGFGGPATPVQPDGTGLPAGQNHGSISSVYVTGSLATNDLVVYAVDEDLNSTHVAGGTGNASDRNSLWKWTVGGGAPNYSTMPTQLTAGISTSPAFPAYNPGLIGDFPAGGILVDMARGPDGKFYMTQNRAGGTVDGLIVGDATTGAIIWDSLAATRTLTGDPAARDLFTGMGGVDISPDGKWLAAVSIDNDLVLVPLVNGLPDIANRLVMDSGTNTGNGRDIAWDAAGNLYYVSSGQGLYRELSPGGHTTTTLTWNGTTYTFDSQSTNASLTGDYNGDGKVDAADYVLWRKNPANFGGDPAGYNAWRGNFGAGGPGAGSSLGGASVPEPSSIALVAFGLIALVGGRRRAG